MPSLRRTFSSPSVRSSPYPTALSNSSAHGSARVNGHPYRRSSGSETSGRRVLADLEWWRVIDGQHDGEAEQESEDRDQDQDSIPEPVASTGDHLSLVEDAGVDRPSTPVNWLFQSPTDTVESHMGLPVNQFAALSIAPSTPPRLTRRHTHGVESTSSSLESTPEAPEQPRERIRFSMLDSDMGFTDAELPPMLPSFGLACPRPAPPPFLMNRSISYEYGTAGRFADIGVDIFS